MPYDGTDFDHEPQPVPPPKRDLVKERILCGLAVAFALLLLALPISAGSLVDVARHIAGR
jgi:hypothetical protein